MRWLVILAMCAPLWAACPDTVNNAGYVRAAASGTASGADWTNAYTDLPASLTRGCTYYVAGGAYGVNHTFNDAVSGTTLIIIQGATTTTHGTATGWNNTYAVSATPATWTCTSGCGAVWNVGSENYVVFNGATCVFNSIYHSICTKGTAGFQIVCNGHCGNGNTGNGCTQCGDVMGGIGFNGSPSTSHDQSFEYLEIDGNAQSTDGGLADACFDFEGGSYDLYFSHNYLYKCSWDFFLRGNHQGQAGFGTGKDITIEYTYMTWDYTDQGSGTGPHGSACSCSEGLVNFAWRYNITTDMVGTSWTWDTASGGDYNTGNGNGGPWYMYGSLFYVINSTHCLAGDGISAMYDFSMTNGDVWYVNNTYSQANGYNVCGGGFNNGFNVGLGFRTPMAGWHNYNDLWYQADNSNVNGNCIIYNGSTNVGCGGGTVTFSPAASEGYIAWFASPNSAANDTGPNKQTSAANPFRSIASQNYTLVADTAAGFAISNSGVYWNGSAEVANTFNVDMNGITRGANGTWDRGAMQIPASIVFSQYGTGFGPGLSTLGTPPTVGVATLPQQWATKIIHPNFTTTRTLGTGAFYACTTGDTCFAALQQAICDWISDGVDDSWLIKITHGTFAQTGQAHTCTQTGATTYKTLTMLPKIINGHQPQGYLVFDSDTPLPEGTTVCSHGTDDTATRQPPSGDISTWWTGTNFGCANDIGSMWTFEADWPLAGNLGSLITAGQWDATTNLGPAGYVFRNAEFRMTPGVAIPSDMIKTSYGAIVTMTNPFQGSNNIHFENLYIHGDAKDWCNQVGGITQYGPNATGSGYAVNDTGTVAGGTSTATYTIAAIGPGSAVKRVTITFGGGGYSVATGVATTATSGSGTGLTLNIYAVAGSSPSCVTSFNTGGPGTNVATDAINFGDCVNCSLKYSYTDYLTRSGAEGHVIGVPRGLGPLAIVHNWLSGQSINIITGGEAINDPLYYLQNFEYRGNRNTEPPSWIGTGYQGPTGGSGITFKNRQEYKVGQFVVEDGNIWEYSDTSGAQSGQCLQLNPRTCSNAQQCDNPQLVLSDFTITNNICRHAIGGIANVGRSAYPADGGGVAPGFKRVFENNNLMYDLGNSNNLDHNNVVTTPYSIRFESAGQAYVCSGTNASGTITLQCVGGITGLSQTQIQVGDYVIVQGCSDSTWNYPTTGTFQYVHGAVALAGTNPNGFTVVYQNNSAVAASATNCVVMNYEGYPNGVTVTHNTFIMDSTAAGGNNAGIYAGTVPPSFSDTGCAAAGPTNSTATTAISRAGNIVTASVASLTGWGVTLGAGLQTIVEVTGVTPSDFNGNFYYLGQSGGNLTWSQVGANETGTVQGNVAQMGTQCPYNLFSRNTTAKNNLLAINSTTGPSCPTPSVGWQGWFESGGSNQEGCPGGFNAIHCAENILDATTSVATYTDFPGRCPAQYTEMGGTHAGANPPVTLTFPANVVCPGSTATASCVGLQTMMNGVAFDGNDANFQNYVLVPSSVYYAGNANAADDGTSMGANPAAIESAINSKLYTCATPCGAGPQPDSP